MSRRAAILLTALLATACTTPPDPRPAVYIEAERLLRQGVGAYGNEVYPDAANLFAKALDVYRSVDDRTGMLHAYTNLAETALALGNFDACRGHLEQARALAHALDDAAARRRLALLGASLALKSGDNAQARQALDALLPEAGRPGEPVDLAILADRALLAMRLGETVEPWLARYRAALVPDASPLDVARLHRLEGEALRIRGDYPGARERLEQALDGFRQAAHRPGIAATLEGLGLTAREQGDLPGARALLRRALYVRIWIFDRPASLRLLERLITLSEAAGDPQAVQRHKSLHEALSAPDFNDWDGLRAGFDGL